MNLNRRPLSRRDLLRATAIGAFGYSASGWLDALAAQTAATPDRPRYKSCIVLWLTGGMSHIDIWDMKPDVPDIVRGNFRPAATSVPGIQITELLPKLATRMDRLALIRGMQDLNRGGATHDPATADLHGTALFARSGIQTPSLGSAVSAHRGLDDFGIPTNVVIGSYSRFDRLVPGAGFLGPRHAPMMVPDPSRGIDNLRPVLAENSFQERVGLLEELQQGFDAQHQVSIVGAHRVAYQNAVGFMRSSKARAFDISQEPGQVRDAYGRNQFGNGCLLARRLVQIGLPFVEVKWLLPVQTSSNSDTLPWDTHAEMVRPFQYGLPILDAAFSSLLDDLQVRGLLDSTLIVCLTEFGRTPRPDRRGGRDHYARVFSALLAGGGIRTGQVIGRTSADASEVVDRPVSRGDLLATVCAALEINADTEFSRDGRRIDPNRRTMSATGAPVLLFGRDANPIRELL